MRLKNLDALRGLAALGVVLYHYAEYLLPSIAPNALTGVLHYGQYGVQVFFVISGLVIPWSMARAGHTLKDIPVFLFRRVVRIGPSAWISCALMIAFWHWQLATAPGHAHLPWPGYDARAIVANLTFTAGHLGTWFYNFPHWTLAVEFQFYAVIAVLLPAILVSRYEWAGVAACLLLAAAPYTGMGSFCANAGAFAMGLALFLRERGSVRPVVLWCLLAAITVSMLMRREAIGAGCALGTAVVIVAGVPLTNRVSAWLGKVSYSLYIIHVPAGLFAENLVFRYTAWHATEGGKLLLLFGYTALSVAFAGFFHRWAEAPFMEMAKRAGRAWGEQAARYARIVQDVMGRFVGWGHRALLLWGVIR